MDKLINELERVRVQLGFNPEIAATHLEKHIEIEKYMLATGPKKTAREEYDQMMAISNLQLLCDILNRFKA